MRLALVSTKGGTGKTTSAVSLAMVLHRRGRTLAGCSTEGPAALDALLHDAYA